MSLDTSAPLDPRARRWRFAIQAIATLVLGLVVAPYVWVAIGGLVGLLVAGIIVGTTWMLLPWLGDKAANLRLPSMEPSSSSPAPILIPDWTEPLSCQQVLDRAREWARTHERCVLGHVHDERCLYRSEDRTNACLMGAHIPDALYTRAMENKVAVVLFTERDWQNNTHPWCAELRKRFLPEVYESRDLAREVFIDRVQQAHDTNDTREAILAALDKVADDFGLA